MSGGDDTKVYTYAGPMTRAQRALRRAPPTVGPFIAPPSEPLDWLRYARYLRDGDFKGMYEAHIDGGRGVRVEVTLVNNPIDDPNWHRVAARSQQNVLIRFLWQAKDSDDYALDRQQSVVFGLIVERDAVDSGRIDLSRANLVFIDFQGLDGLYADKNHFPSRVEYDSMAVYAPNPPGNASLPEAHARIRVGYATSDPIVHPGTDVIASSNMLWINWFADNSVQEQHVSRTFNRDGDETNSWYGYKDRRDMLP